MQKLMFIVLIGWLAAAPSEVSANPLRVAEKPALADFRGLNRYLSEKLPQIEELQANVAAIKSGLPNGVGAGVREAAQKMLALVESSSDEECTNEMMALLLEFKESSMMVLAGDRVKKLLGPSHQKALALCTKYIEDHYREIPAKRTSFFQVFNAWGNEEFRRGAWFGFLRDHHFYRGLRQLVKLMASPAVEPFEIEGVNPRTGNPTVQFERDHFETAFEELLVKPCQNILSDGHLLENMLALTSADIQQYWIRFGEQLPVQIDYSLVHMSWTRDACGRIIDMDATARSQVVASV